MRVKQIRRLAREGLKRKLEAEGVKEPLVTSTSTLPLRPAVSAPRRGWWLRLVLWVRRLLSRAGAPPAPPPPMDPRIRAKIVARPQDRLERRLRRRLAGKRIYEE
jgi:hypothetical protein